MFRQPLPAHKHLNALKFTSFKYLKYIKPEEATNENADYKRHLLYDTLEDVFQILCLNVCFIYAVWYICLKWLRYNFRSLPTLTYVGTLHRLISVLLAGIQCRPVQFQPLQRQNESPKKGMRLK